MSTEHNKINQPLNPEHGVRDADHPGYETTDVNVNGIAVFLAGLFGSVLIFFVFCFVLGKVINGAIKKEDGPVNKWSQNVDYSGAAENAPRQDMASAAEMEQKQLQQITQTFPAPRLDIDDGEQSTADLHAREDLLLNYYSVDNGTIRIPITHAMALIAQQGLPVEQAGQKTETAMFGDDNPVILAPLTTGFARTGYELDVIAAREQKLAYNRAESAENTDPGAAK
ncbi:hypothetical protein GCM10011507_23200 [Edaphobacter acidisoli]|uniref:Uncharacterized protein n=1 Tax=Edaphobacter acidisoli TaxID=2040573 RepID=A0A916RUI2_9BACT|nr:hypothetical protein [Edaphobacter acidisoli]GGA70981.1 hypothetical protein GCM10011507_23200 [Edaphobacter acidisoli]